MRKQRVRYFRTICTILTTPDPWRSTPVGYRGRCASGWRHWSDVHTYRTTTNGLKRRTDGEDTEVSAYTDDKARHTSTHVSNTHVTAFQWNCARARGRFIMNKKIL